MATEEKPANQEKGPAFQVFGDLTSTVLDRWRLQARSTEFS